MQHPLLAYRERHGLTRKEMAARIGASHQAVRFWELGLRRPRPETADEIERATNGEVTRAALWLGEPAPSQGAPA